jgi:hypothetical protein
MARAKRYAERVNILKKVRVNGLWKLASVLTSFPGLTLGIDGLAP